MTLEWSPGRSDEDTIIELRSHDRGRELIEMWRGHSLDLYSRGERIIGQTLEAMRVAAPDQSSVNLPHMAGQRTEELAKQALLLDLTAKQAKALGNAVETWKAFEMKRVYIAHGSLTTALDTRGRWLAVFDVTIYRNNEPRSERWAMFEPEALEFAAALEAAWKQLSAQLGFLRKLVAMQAAAAA